MGFTEVDYEIIMRARKGDEAAYDFIVTRYAGLIRRKARQFFLCGGSHDDLVQEGLIGLFKAVNDYRPDRGSSFRTFVELCVTRQIISAVKHASRDKHRFLNTAVPLEGNIFSGGEGGEGEVRLSDILADSSSKEPPDQVIGAELAGNLINGLLEMLTGLEAEVLSLYLQEKSYEEIADAIGRDAKCVDNAIQRIRRKVNLLMNR